MLRKKIPAYLFILSLAFTSVMSYSLSTRIHKNKLPAAADPETDNAVCRYNLKRLEGYSYIKPLMYAEPECESYSFNAVKKSITDIITAYTDSGRISSASVYFRDFYNGDWTNVGGEKKYAPGSLLKIPEMIAFMRMNEKDPGTLDKKITFAHEFNTGKNPVFLSKSIQLGKSYSIRELLKYMITYSDNNATMLLNENLDLETFGKVFTDLGIEKPDWKASQTLISAKDFSQFMKVLYNASYLTIPDSEFCTGLLATSDFNEGMLSGFPPHTKVAHKFGEGGYSDKANFSESCIVFFEKRAFILTIMTEGKDMKALPKVIAAISKACYVHMNTLVQQYGSGTPSI